MRIFSQPPSLTRLNTLMRYSRATGHFIRNVSVQGGYRAGEIAGCLHKSSGYWVIGIDGVKYQAHALAWYQETGEWLPNGVDHKDLNRANNKWSNLRKDTASQNLANAPRHRNNKSGFKGVHRFSANRFRAQIKKDGKVIYLGLFETAEAAAVKYAEAARLYHGEFARHDVGQRI